MYFRLNESPRGHLHELAASPQFFGRPLWGHLGQVAPADPATCPGYQPGEVERSRTAAGHLASDAITMARGFLLRDFGVDWRHPKASLRSEPALRTWLNTLVQVVRDNPTTTIRILGFSDCVGQERNNMLLRRGRALRVRELLQQMAGADWRILQPRIVFTNAAPAGDYIGPNSTVDGRANNRSVLVEHTRTVNMDPITVEVTRTTDTLERIVRRGLELVQSLSHFGVQISVHQQQRIRCILTRLSRPGFDDRYLTGQGVLDYLNNVYMTQPYYANATQWLFPDFAQRSGRLVTDENIWRMLIRIDDDILQGRNRINYYYHTHGAATPVRIQRLRDWVAQRQNDDLSIYRCYR